MEERQELVAEIPMGRFGDAMDVAALVVFLAGEPAGYISGTAINVDGAFSRSIL
jgi:3-oxoacyl-[acyl-carrier protein] reductase